MKVWQSKLNRKTGQRHLVLDMTRQEEAEAFWVLRHEVIGHRGMAPRRRVLQDGSVRYRFRSRHLDRLVSTFPFAELSPGLERRMRRAQTVDLGNVEVPELDIPDFRTELYDFQKIAVAAIVERLSEAGVEPVGFMLNDEMGLGKTIMALASALKMMTFPTLVVCPASAKWVWKRAAEQFTDLDCVVADGNPSQRLEAIGKRADITVINVEMLRNEAFMKALLEQPYELAIVDEFHRFKSPKAAQTKGFHRLDSRRWLLMSGTPILNRVEEAWSGLHRLFPDRFPSYYNFTKWICIKRTVETHKKERNAQGREVVKTRRFTKVVGYNPKAFKSCKKFVHEHSIRRRKDQVLKDLPEVVYSTVLVELTPEQKRLYRQITEEMKLALEDGSIRDVRGMLSMVTRTKQVCFSPELYGGSPTSQKIQELKEIVRQLVDNGEKAIIFSQWSKACQILRRELAEYNPAYVTGSVPAGPRRTAQEDKFNDDPECWLYIGTIGANREAITLGAATYVIFTDKDWVPMNNDQAIARSAAGGLRGVGVTGTVNVIELFANGTVEERIEALLASKRATFNNFVEEDGGAVVERLTVAELCDLF